MPKRPGFLQKRTANLLNGAKRFLEQSSPSVTEIAFNSRGFEIYFLPKFHCELNFIEQCWGFAKRVYRLNPESSREDVLKRNAIAALDAVPIESMRR